MALIPATVTIEFPAIKTDQHTTSLNPLQNLEIVMKQEGSLFIQKNRC